MERVVTAFALLLYSAFFLTLNFTLYQWVNKTAELTKSRTMLMTILLLLVLLFLAPEIVGQKVMEPSKFLSILLISCFILASHFFGRFGITRIKQIIPQEKHGTKAFSYIMGFHRFFWYKVNFLFFSVAQLFMIWAEN